MIRIHTSVRTNSAECENSLPRCLLTSDDVSFNASCSTCFSIKVADIFFLPPWWKWHENNVSIMVKTWSHYNSLMILLYMRQTLLYFFSRCYALSWLFHSSIVCVGVTGDMWHPSQGNVETSDVLSHLGGDKHSCLLMLCSPHLQFYQDTWRLTWPLRSMIQIATKQTFLFKIDKIFNSYVWIVPTQAQRNA